MDIQLIDRIYESCFAPEVWPDVLDELGRIGGGPGASLFVSNAVAARDGRGGGVDGGDDCAVCVRGRRRPSSIGRLPTKAMTLENAVHLCFQDAHNRFFHFTYRLLCNRDFEQIHNIKYVYDEQETSN